MKYRTKSVRILYTRDLLERESTTELGMDCAPTAGRDQIIR